MFDFDCKINSYSAVINVRFFPTYCQFDAKKPK